MFRNLLLTVTTCFTIVLNRNFLVSSNLKGQGPHKSRAWFRNEAAFIQRKLERICPPASDLIWDTNLNDDSTEEDIIKNNRFSSYMLGEKSNNILQQMRRKPDVFYQNLVDNLIMVRCNVTLESPRCAPQDSDRALVNHEGTCLAVADTLCSTGMCEREANCYWNPINSTFVNRTRRYAPDLFLKAKESLVGLKEGSYLRGLLKITLIGSVIAMVLLVIWLVYFMGRCCCCCLWTSFCYSCSPIPKEEGYLICWHWIIPAMLYLLLTAVAMLSAFYSYMGVSAMEVSFIKSISYAIRVLDGLITATDSSRSALVNVLNTTGTAALSSLALYNSTNDINIKMSEISHSFETFESLYPSSSPFVINSVGNIGTLTQIIRTMINIVKENIYDGRSLTELTMKSLITEMEAFNTLLSSWLALVMKIRSTEFDLRLYVKIGLMALSLVTVLLSVFGVLTIGFSSCKRRCLSCSRFLGFIGFVAAIIGSISLITASVFLSLNVLWLDGCNSMDFIYSDIRPFVGSRQGTIAHHLFNGANISNAFGVDHFDYITTWDINQQALYGINVTYEFAKMAASMSLFQIIFIDSITKNTTLALNDLTSNVTPSCPFNDHYTEQNVLEPWNANGGKSYTLWPLFSTGLTGIYGRLGNETALDYMERIYHVAGSCNSSVACCLNQSCNLPVGHSCNSGSNCKILCLERYNAIVQRYNNVLDAFSVQQKMSADWGMVCPLNMKCPTELFRDFSGINKTISDVVQSSKQEYAKATMLLINMTSSPVDEFMGYINDFMCNSNVSFTNVYYTLIKEEMCGAMVAGFSQINVSLWVVSIILEMIALLSCMLSIRMRGRSRKEKLFDAYDDLVTVATAYKPPE